MHIPFFSDRVYEVASTGYSSHEVPNVTIECRPEKGVGDGFLQIRVVTHNGCGISKNSVVALSLGEARGKTTLITSPPAKKFRGSLDILWGSPT